MRRGPPISSDAPPRRLIIFAVLALTLAGLLLRLAAARGDLWLDEIWSLQNLEKLHGVGGIWGALATGLFASTAVNPLGFDGLFYGNPAQLGKQAVAVAVVAIFTAVVTAIILKVIDVTIGLRVPEQEEVLGLDTTTHGEVAYQL